MSQNPSYNPMPDSDGNQRQPEGMRAIIEARFLAENNDADFIRRLRQTYAHIIVFIALIVPLCFLSILFTHIGIGNFFSAEAVVPQSVFISGTILCFVTTYGFLLTNIFKQPATMSDLKWRDFSEEGGTNKNFDSKYEYYKDNRGEYRWRLIDDHHQIIAKSEEGFSSRQSLIESVDKIRQHAPDAPIYVIGKDGDGGYRFQCFDGKDGDGYWRLVAGNGEPMAVGGEGYSGGANAAKRALEDNTRTELGRASVPW